MSASKAEVNEKQIFVRNLPFDVTSENLSELFEDIGPLKNTSVASENGVGKGFGFVKFALESDAKLAIEKLQGHVFHGRKIILELGHKKERKGRSKEAADKEATETGETEATEATEATPAKSVKIDNAALKKEKKDAAKARQDKSDECSVGGDSIKKSRQVLVFGIPKDINKKHFRALATRGFKKTDVDLLKEDHELSGELHITTPAGKVMLLTAPSRQEAGKITTALNNATVHSLIVALQAHHKLQVAQQLMLNKKKAAKGKAEGKEVGKIETAKDPLEGLDLAKVRKEKLFLRTAVQITPTDQRKRKCRLIIRNLSFLATEQNVLDKMSKFGPIVSVELPKKAPTERTEENKFQGKSRRPEKENKEPAMRSMGFGFVTFLCESDAQHVVDNCAGLKVCNREVAVDFCMAKETYEKFGKKQDEQASVTEAGAEAAEGDADSDESVHGSEDGDANDEGAEGSDAEGNEGDEGEGTDEDSQGDSGDEDSQGDSDGDDGSDDGSDQDDDASDASDSEGKASKATKAAPSKKEPTEDVHEGCTVFVRGLGFDAEPADLKRTLGKYGRISLALIVKDKVTDISKGSAFVKFLSPESASACVAEALLLGGISIKDRSCKIDLAVDRQSAQSIKDSELAKRGKDKRNLYLSNEGLILPGAEGSEEHAHGAASKAGSMSEADKEKRMRAQTEKRKKLVNPLFFVSANRLSIRNLAKTITDKELRDLCLAAAKNGIKKGLVKRTDMEQYKAAQGIEYVQQQAQLHGFAKPGADLDAVPPAVGKHCLKNAKIMLDMQRIRGGAPQSRGYAFAEFTHHAHALACLRELNNNAMYSSHHSQATNGAAADPTGGKLIVEFALENIQKVKILRDREARVQKRKNDSAPSQDGEAGSSSKPDNARTIKRKAAAEANAARSSSAPVVVAEEPAKVVQAPKKPVKSYVVDPDTLPVALPEGVNPKLHNRQLEKERLKRKRQEKLAAAAAAPAVDAAVAASAEAPAGKKAKTSHVASAPTPVAVPVVKAAQPAAPKQAEAPKAAKAQAQAPTPAAPKAKWHSEPAEAPVSGKKRKEASSDTAPVAAAAAPAEPAQKPKPQQAAAEPQAKKQKAAIEKAPAAAAEKATVTPKPVQAQAPKNEKTEQPNKGKQQVKFEGKKDNNAGKNSTPSKQDNKQNHNNKDSKQSNAKGASIPAASKGSASPGSAEGTPVQRPWGGHKRLRAKKMAGGKK